MILVASSLLLFASSAAEFAARPSAPNVLSVDMLLRIQTVTS